MKQLRQFDAFFAGKERYAYRLFGAHRKRDGIQFCVYAPCAREIFVIGSFNAWKNTHRMQKMDDRGVWKVVIKDANIQDLYKYRIVTQDGTWLDKADPYAFYSELRPATASIVYDIGFFVWGDDAWMKKRSRNQKEAMHIYEMHLGSWMQKKDGTWLSYRTLAKPLIAYCKNMHITHVEFLPLQEHPLDASWGYLCSGYFSLTSRYGTPQDFQYLVDALHRANIGVIMDFVGVHFVKDAFALARFDGSALYEYEEDSIWGSANFAFGKPIVRSFLLSAMTFLLGVFHVDGLRMDAISHMIYPHGEKQKGLHQEGLFCIQQINQSLHQHFPQAILIAEDSSDHVGVCDKNGLDFDYKWDLGWMHDTLTYLAMDPIYRRWHHHQLTFSMMYFYDECFVLPFSHDEVVHGKKTIIDKIWGNYEQKFAQLRTLYMYLFTHPGKKLSFMGNEIAHFREWDENKEVDWFLLKYPIHDSFHQYYRQCAALYQIKDALHVYDHQHCGFQWIDADNAYENLYSYLRRSETKDIVVILNFSGNAYFRHPFLVKGKGIYKELLNSQWNCFGGCVKKQIQKVKTKQVQKGMYQIEVDIPAFGGVMLEHQYRKKRKMQ